MYARGAQSREDGLRLRVESTSISTLVYGGKVVFDRGWSGRTALSQTAALAKVAAEVRRITRVGMARNFPASREANR
jgi:hypothetical protein